jgi:lipopolysaccharide transport system ATP-binding protein
VVRDGRTILFVSHNIAVVQKLCTSAVLIEGGRLVTKGPTADVVAAYLERIGRNASFDLSNSHRTGKGEVRFTRIEVHADEENPQRALSCGAPASVVLYLDKWRPGLACAITIYDWSGQAVTDFNSSEHSDRDVMQPRGSVFRCEISELMLVPGRYRLRAALWLDLELQDEIEGAAVFEVAQGLVDGRVILRNQDWGSAIMHHRWIAPT